MADDIYHWNINGLKCKRSPNYSGKINQISSILESTSTAILNIQETHISNDKELPNFLNTYSHLFTFEKTFASSGDVFSGILVCIRKTDIIITTEILENGRLLYIKIMNEASNSYKHIFSIYCNPSDPPKQKHLITKLRDKISINHIHAESCIIMGDFNFVTSILDRNSQSMNRTDLETSKEWGSFEENFNFQDTFRLTNPSKRLYSLILKSNKKVKARIDRVYCTSDLCGKILSTSFIPSLLSDHKIVKIKMAINIDKGRGLWVFNNSYLKEEAYCTKIKEISESTNFEDANMEDRRSFWDFKKQLFINFSKNYALDRAKASKKEYYEHKNEFEKLETLHQQKLTPYILERIAYLKNKIDEFDKNRIKGSLLRTKIPNFEENDPKIAYLNKLEKRKGEENTIYYLLDEETSTLKNTTIEIKEVVHNFYKKLYMQESEDTTLQFEFLQAIDKKLEEDDKMATNILLDESNLFKSLKNMKRDKSPGISGLTMEWYFHFWSHIKEDYINCVKEIEIKKELAEMQKRGAIKISYKKGDRKMIKNYRPITLLDIDLKIITKTLADRMVSILPKLIHEDQTCVPGRHIENNIHLTQDLIDHANAKSRNLALIFIDQEKAFDRLSHSFIFKTLERFGFGEYFINWVKTICFDTKSLVKVNGYETFEFSIGRGVRQGCPLSPLLYVLAAEALSSSIRKNNNIKGYIYKMRNLSPLEHKIKQYADDTQIAVTDIPSITEVFKTLNKYEKATNAKVNKDKTEALWVGNWKGRQDKPLNLKWKNDTIKSLGISVGNKVEPNGQKMLSELNFAEQIEIIKNKISYWKGKGLPLMSRVKIVNIFILSLLWYRSNIWDITKNHIELLNRMVRNFVWEEKRGARVRQDVLQLQYEQGGLQLVDITCKIQVQRVRRIFYLMTLDSNHIERFLADELVGNCLRQRQYGLSYGLFNNKPRIRTIKNSFYKGAFETLSSLNVMIGPAEMNTIQNEPLFYNTLFINTSANDVFKLTRYKNQMPKKLRDLQNFPHSREQEVNETVAQLRRCIQALNLTHNHQNYYFILKNNVEEDISNCNFKDLYLTFLNKKTVIKEWEDRWLNYLLLDEIDWGPIWTRLHSNFNNSYVVSALWESFHLNFWSNFRANERCHLCKQLENDITHIINDCKILTEIIEFLNLNHIYDNKFKITFGVENENIANYILFQIRSVVFRSRFKTFHNLATCKLQLIKKCKSNIKRDLKSRFDIAKSKNQMADFCNTFLPNRDDGENSIYFWKLNGENSLEFL